MNILLFGATGMVGQGVLRECLLDPDVRNVLSIVRTATAQQHEKLHELVHADFQDFSMIEERLTGFDACFFCLGVTSAGMSEERYRQVTYGITLAAASPLARLNPGMTFIYVSGMGADSTGRSRTMWARVRGETENAVLGLPFKAAYIFRPAAIVPLHGIKSRTSWYRILYALSGRLLPFLQPRLPKYVTTTEQVGRAMLKVVKHGAPKTVLENSDINAV